MNSSIVGNIPRSCHPKVKLLTEYWQAIHPTTGLPGRQHFDPCDIPSILRHLFLVDIDAPNSRFTWRLMGTALVSIFGRDHTGLPLEGAYRAGTRANSYQAVCAVVATKQPQWRRAPAAFAENRDYLTMERVVFPLARDGTTVDMALGMILAHQKDGDVV